VVVITGGHREHAIDVFFDGDRLVEIRGERYPGGAAHGSGCTHSSVLAAHLARGEGPLEAARVAKEMASLAVRDGLEEIGAGAGPVDVLGISSRPHRVSPARRAEVSPGRRTEASPGRRAEASQARRTETSPLT